MKLIDCGGCKGKGRTYHPTMDPGSGRECVWCGGAGVLVYRVGSTRTLSEQEKLDYRQQQEDIAALEAEGMRPWAR